MSQLKVSPKSIGGTISNLKVVFKIKEKNFTNRYYMIFKNTEKKVWHHHWIAISRHWKKGPTSPGGNSACRKEKPKIEEVQ